MEIKFEVFKILVTQILIKIINILKEKEDTENELTIQRNPSKVSDTDFNESFKIIISYFIDTKPDCFYYYDINLFFYKMFSNSIIILRSLLSLTPNAMIKIMKISFYEEYKNYEKNYLKNKLIMIKLFYHIIENIDDDYDYLSKCIKDIEKEKIIIENPFIFLFEKVLDKINNNNEEKLINIYYTKILLICLDRIIKLENNLNNIKKLIKNNINNIIILLNDDKSYISGN